MKPASPLKDAIDKVIAKMTGIMSRKEIVEAVLKHYPSKAKDPASSIMNDLRWRKEVVVLGDGLYARADYVLDGAKFRIKVAAEDLALGILQPTWFKPFDHVMPPSEGIFAGSDGEVIPVVKKGLDVSRLSNEQLDAMLIELGESVLRDPLRVLALPLFGKESEAAAELDEELDEAELLRLGREKLKEKLAEAVERHDLPGENFDELFGRLFGGW